MTVVFCGTTVTGIYVHHWAIQLFTQSTLNDCLLSSRKWNLTERIRLRREVTWVYGIQSLSNHSTIQSGYLSSSIFLLYTFQTEETWKKNKMYTKGEQNKLPQDVPLGHVDCFSSVQFSRSIVTDSLWPHESQYTRPPCPSPTPGVHPNSRPSSQWCHPTISSSVVPFSSCPQSLLASESFPMSQLFAWGGQSTAVSALASFLPKKSQSWSPSEWTGWISLQSKGLSRVLPNTTVQKQICPNCSQFSAGNHCITNL